MIRIATACIASVTILVPAHVVTAQSTDPSVTLFSSGMSLVRRTVPVSLPRGSSTQPLPLGIIDPATLTSLSAGVAIDAVEFDGSVDEAALLRRNIGRIFRIIPGKDALAPRARLLAVGPERWQLLREVGDDPVGVVFHRPGKLVWPSETVPLAPTTEATISSDRDRQSINVMYQTSGGSWNADYRLILGKPAMLEGNAIIQTGVLDLANASVQLLAGDIGRRRSPAPLMARAMESKQQDTYIDGVPVSAGNRSSAIGQARLFDLPGKVTFVPGSELVRSLFSSVEVHPELHLVLNAEFPSQLGVTRQPGDYAQPVFASYRLPHVEGTDFGRLALPAGIMSVYQADGSGRLQLIGEGGVSQVAPGDSVEVAIGTSFDVTARRRQTAFKLSREPGGRTTTAEVSYSTVFSNGGGSAADVELRIGRPGDWELVSSSLPAERISSTRMIIPVHIPAGGEVTVDYRLRVTW